MTGRTNTTWTLSVGSLVKLRCCRAGGRGQQAADQLQTAGDEDETCESWKHILWLRFTLIYSPLSPSSIRVGARKGLHWEWRPLAHPSRCPSCPSCLRCPNCSGAPLCVQVERVADLVSPLPESHVPLSIPIWPRFGVVVIIYLKEYNLRRVVPCLNLITRKNFQLVSQFCSWLILEDRQS